MIGRDKYKFNFKLEPIFSKESTLIAYELLTNIHETEANRKLNPHAFFLISDESIIYDILIAQVEISASLIKERKIPVDITLNITETMLNFLCDNIDIRNRINKINDRLIFEISEDIDLCKNKNQLMELNRISRLWIDDFGVGFSNKQNLHLDIFEYVKLDRLFVINLLCFKSGCIFLKELIDYLHKNKVKIICEGVENKTFLDSISCYDFDGLQGWFWESIHI
ncbi:EAL domain-containing protein [Enterobacter asburiae]|uniref:EAL domain-containing protein n=1 Tax=Enterobacter asburiae TaxID=61645 RepID=UPI00192C88CF|nr:EAL domain-containing protein [Enterobacter asburiae]MBL5950326.1 EAL domain-containing protein [Enterobacter asburiae]